MLRVVLSGPRMIIAFQPTLLDPSFTSFTNLATMTSYTSIPTLPDLYDSNRSSIARPLLVISRLTVLASSIVLWTHRRCPT
jgi:hypothetical protein